MGKLSCRIHPHIKFTSVAEMKKCTLIILLVVAFGSAEDHQPTARIFAIKTTYTRVNVVTSTEVVTKPEVCASLVDVTGVCRRKRGLFHVISLVPTPVRQIERTAAPVLSVERDVNIESSSDGFERVDVIGLERFHCDPESRFNVGNIKEIFRNVTLAFFVKLNATLTVTETVVSGTKPFVLTGCTPAPFNYKICDEEKDAAEVVTEEVPVTSGEAVADNQVVEELIPEEPVDEEPIQEEAVADNQILEEPIPQEPVKEEPIPEEPVEEEPIPEEPVEEEPIPEEPVEDEPIPEEPVEEELIPEDVPEEPIAEQLVAAEF